MNDFLEMKPPERYSVEEGWTKQDLPPIVQNFRPSAPGNRYWYGCLLGSLGHSHVKEGCTILDYGCGNAPLAVYLSGKLSRFTYYGLEPAGSPFVRSAPQHPAIHAGFIGSALEQEAIDKSGCAVLGSVFTHLEWKDNLEILDKLLPIAKRGGAIVFSCFLANEEIYIGPDHYPHSSCPSYHYAFIPISMIEKYARQRNLQCELTTNFYSLGTRLQAEVVHRFVKLSG